METTHAQNPHRPSSENPSPAAPVRGVTRQVTVDFELTDAGRAPQGSRSAAFTGRTVIDRNDRASAGPAAWSAGRGRWSSTSGGTPVLTRAGARNGPGPRP